MLVELSPATTKQVNMASMRVRARRRHSRISKALRVRALAEVRAILAPISPGGQLQFLFRPKGSLSGATPMQAISAGRFKAVMVAARGFVER